MKLCQPPVRVPATLALAISASEVVHIAGTTLSATGKLARAESCIPTSAPRKLALPSLV